MKDIFVEQFFVLINPVWDLSPVVHTMTDLTDFGQIYYLEISLNSSMYHSVHPSPFCWGRWTSYEIFKKCGGWGLTGSQFLVEVAGKEGVTFFRGGLQFFDK